MAFRQFGKMCIYIYIHMWVRKNIKLKNDGLRNIADIHVGLNKYPGRLNRVNPNGWQNRVSPPGLNKYDDHNVKNVGTISPACVSWRSVSQWTSLSVW